MTKLWEIRRRTTERFFGPDRSFERAQAADVSAKVVAERPMAHLERSGFVIMRKPIPVGGSAPLNPPASYPRTKLEEMK